MMMTICTNFYFIFYFKKKRLGPCEGSHLGTLEIGLARLHSYLEAGMRKKKQMHKGSKTSLYAMQRK